MSLEMKMIRITNGEDNHDHDHDEDDLDHNAGEDKMLNQLTIPDRMHRY